MLRLEDIKVYNNCICYIIPGPLFNYIYKKASNYEIASRNFPKAFIQFNFSASNPAVVINNKRHFIWGAWDNWIEKTEDFNIKDYATYKMGGKTKIDYEHFNPYVINWINYQYKEAEYND